MTFFDSNRYHLLYYHILKKNTGQETEPSARRDARADWKTGYTARRTGWLRGTALLDRESDWLPHAREYVNPDP
jgi:hypothetical protein